MQNILVICENKDSEKKFIDKYATDYQTISFVKNGDVLIGSRFHEVYIDQNLSLSKDYINHIYDVLVQNYPTEFKYF